MRKEEYIKRYGEAAYEEYKKRQAELTKRWRGNNRSKSRKYALDYYHRGNKTRVSAVYQIINTVTGDRYVGSSKDIEKRWSEHKRPSVWKIQPNNLLYQDMQKYGVENFRFQILAPVMEEYLTQVEQEFIELLQPTYNRNRAKGRNYEEFKEVMRVRNNQPCSYNGETLTLGTLYQRFRKVGIKHPMDEAKKYLLNQ